MNNREYISREAEGSGFPEIKAILSGVTIPRFLSVNAYCGKYVGIVGMVCGGMSVGRSGTYVH